MSMYIKANCVYMSYFIFYSENRDWQEFRHRVVIGAIFCGFAALFKIGESLWIAVGVVASNPPNGSTWKS